MRGIGARRQMLLLCAALTLIVVAGGMQVRMLGLADGLTGPMVPVLVSIFLAAALLASTLLVSKAASKKAKRVSDDERVPQVGSGSVGDGMEAFCNPQLEDYFSTIKGELAQVDRLAADAAGELVASFKFISQLTRSQQDISLAIAAAVSHSGATVPEHLLERQAAIAGQIDQEVDEAVRSLQFGDLVAQLLNHTMVRVDAIGAALQRVDLLDADQDNSELSRRRGQFHEGIARAVILANAAGRRKPVVQHGMETGEIEMF